ncbi:MAG TPA: ATP-binding protein [Kofleriaceae bacterium]|nr:ATP-binding protein [Kofleriaceae bacterium]
MSGSEREVDESVVRMLEQELQDTRQELQGTVEQLETANEEYRASHEELLSLNEELQSTNEELETSKEELQSLNEELTTMNHQLEERNTELATLTSDLNNLLISAGVPTLFLDRQLRIRRFTPACTELMDLTPRDAGRSFEQIRAKLDDSGLLEGGDLLGDINRVLERLIPVEAEVRSDEDRWFTRRVLPFRTDDDRIDGTCITFHEITAQKKAAQDSQQAREYAEAIVRSSRIPLLVLDSELRVISASDAFFQAFQLGERERMGQRLFALSNRQWDIPKLRTLLETILPKDREVRNYDLEHVFEVLGWRALRLNATVMSASDRTDLLLVSIEDVTDLRRAEAEARQRADELAQDHRRKDEFLAMLGHELRNPLAALASGVDLIRRTPGVPERVEQVGAMMARQGNRMATMLDQLLDVGRVISGKLTLASDAVDVSDAVYSAIEAVKPMIAAANQHLEVSLPERGTAVVLGDGVRLAQVVENLLANATKYSEPGAHLWVMLEASDDEVKIAVRDEGMGMDPEVLDHAFDLFTQSPRSLHRSKGGLGLGLPLVRSLVQMHGGSVEGRSDGLGSGSEFVVTLPLLRAGQFRPARAEPVLPESPPRKVMVVEDQEDAAAPLIAILEMEGHQVRLFTNGPEALEAARADPPEVVLLDLGLPDMDGYRVAEELRRSLGEHVVLVAVTGYQRDPAQLHRAGFDEHLLKPPSIQRIFELLASVGVARQQRLPY